ncbi:Hypothetical protein LUCI_0264 [Lucifera butyrica]|uniref:Uncharacterized protein n=1 Tax=Lucifera butyrica TaxID=1351585 RepID=A0A498R7F2_9FIRM|nr:Hypothetical protein LUCI_0264 [Lucifera butyrica]
MADNSRTNCSHPRMCPHPESFRQRIRQKKLSLEPLPPGETKKDR